MTADLAQFLRARLDEDEQTARAAIHADGRSWQVSGSHADEGGTYWCIAAPTDGPSDVVELVGSGMSGGGAHTAEVAEHIARHDPARVLAEVYAKRALLDDLDYGGGEMADARWHVAQRLASVYADHPDYREEWKP